MIRASLIALACASLTACAALLPAMLLPSLAVKVGVLGAAVVDCETDPLCEAEAPRCGNRTDKGVMVTELPDIAIPTDEGSVTAFEPAYWQSQFASEVGPRVRRPAQPSAGALVITGKSVLFVPPPGMEGVRIPLEGVVDVQLQLSSTTGAPRQMTVESCFGRLDRFTFGQRQQPQQLDSGTTSASAAELRARVEAYRAAAKKQGANAR